MKYEKPDISLAGAAISSIQGQSLPKQGPVTDDSILHNGDFRPTVAAYEADE